MQSQIFSQLHEIIASVQMTANLVAVPVPYLSISSVESCDADVSVVVKEGSLFVCDVADSWSVGCHGVAALTFVKIHFLG